MRYLVLSALLTLSFLSYSQKIVKYYDAEWKPAPKDKSVFYAEFVKEGNVYRCTSFRVAGNLLRGRSTFADTVMENPIGVQLLYFNNGRIEDSVFYENGKTKYLYHYYPNRQLAFHHYLPDNANEAVTEGYDEDGKKIRNFVFEKEAEFKGGQKAWQQYLQKNTSKEIRMKGKGDVNAQVQIKFIVDEDGNVTNVKVFKSSGYKEVDQDAVRVISDSPTWNNAIQYNKPVKALRIQPLTYNLLEEKK